MKSIILILPYFGKWPIWFEAHLLSIAKNPTVNWLIVTDCDIPADYPQNITFRSVKLQHLNHTVNTVVNANVPLTPRKFCDLKPAYGAIFYEDIKDYNFWGFCDLDIIWGNIRKYITPDILENYDIISSRKEAISGHFNLFKNTPELNNLYRRSVPDYQYLFEQPKFMWFDEKHLTNYLKSKMENNQLPFKIKWDAILCNQERGRDSHQEYYLDRWQWQNGKMINTKTKEEVMYLHFINWKRTMKFSVKSLKDEQDSFYISYTGIHYNTHNVLKKLWNSFTNLFDGYYIRWNRKIIKSKVRIYKKKCVAKSKKLLRIIVARFLDYNVIPVVIWPKLLEFVYKDTYVNINPKEINLVLSDRERAMVYSQKIFFIKVNSDEIKRYKEHKAYIIDTVRDFLINNINYEKTIQYKMMIERIKNNERPLYNCRNSLEIRDYFNKLKKSYCNIKNNGYLTQSELNKKSDKLFTKQDDELEVFITCEGELVVSGGSGNHRLCIAKELNLKQIPAKFKGILHKAENCNLKSIKEVRSLLKSYKFNN